jgi:hypothetical protein
VQACTHTGVQRDIPFYLRYFIPQLECLCCCPGCLCKRATDIRHGMRSSAALLRIIRECTLATHEFPALSKQQGCALLPPSLLLDVRDCFSVPVQACADTGQFPASCQALVCVNASLHSRQAVRYGVCLRVAQACSSPKVQRCLADVAEQTECQCKLATDILLSASAVGTPVQACTDVAYALNLHLRTKTHRSVRLAQFPAAQASASVQRPS